MGNPRILLFAALGFVMLLLWQEWQKDYGPQTIAPDGVNQGQEIVTGPYSDASLSAASSPDTQEEELPSLSRDSALKQMSVSRQETPKDKIKADTTNVIHVITDKLDVRINPRGGEISNISLRAYPIALEKQDVPFPLLSKTAKQVYIAQSGLMSRQGAPSHFSMYDTEQNEYSLAEGTDSLRVPLYWKNEKGIQVTKVLIFNRGTHVINVEYEIYNRSADTWTGSQYRELVRTIVESSQGLMVQAFTGAAYYSEEDKFEKIDLDDIADDPLSRDVKGGWVGMLQHYFLSAWIPDKQEINNFYTRKIKNSERYAIGMISSEILIQPGDSRKMFSQLYAGPKEQNVLEKLAVGLRLSVDYSWLTIIAQPIFWLMTFIHDNVIDNWGWSIIILTVLIKLMFFKLSEYGYRSMANMRRVQPKLVSLKERYGSDKQRMQKAMMELYKKEKINPMSGCFPILVQIPVFIALYWVLLESVELRQAPFMLWIKDLSAADPYFVLPLVMGITMFLQQKLNPTPMDETQKMIMKVLPVVFTVFFLFFPAGLVLYWVVNNILSISQQWVITRRIESGTAKS